MRKREKCGKLGCGHSVLAPFGKLPARREGRRERKGERPWRQAMAATRAAWPRTGGPIASAAMMCGIALTGRLSAAGPAQRRAHRPRCTPCRVMVGIVTPTAAGWCLHVATHTTSDPHQFGEVKEEVPLWHFHSLPNTGRRTVGGEAREESERGRDDAQRQLRLQGARRQRDNLQLV